MEPIQVPLNTQFLLPNGGVRFLRTSTGGFTNFTYRAFVNDTIGQSTPVYMFGRGVTGGWVYIQENALFATAVGIGLIPGQTTSSFFQEFAMIPVFPRTTLRRVSIQQINF